MGELLTSARYFFRHPVAQRQPLRSVYRFARWQLLSRIRGGGEFPWIGGTRLVARRGMTGLSGCLYYGLHEFHEMAAVLHILRPDDLFVDVGANAGSYTVLSAGVVGARTIAFEPGAEAVEALERNVAANSLGERVTIHRVAIGDAERDVLFTTGARTTMNRVSVDGDALVRMKTLDAMVSEPVMMKLDIEGGELPALQGARATLRSESLVAVIAESHGPEIMALFREAGFGKYRYDAFARGFSPMTEEEGNAIFIRDLRQVEARVEGAVRRSIYGVDL